MPPGNPARLPPRLREQGVSLQTIRYGGQELRLVEPRGTLRFARDGQTLIAASDAYGSGFLQVFSLPSGERHAGPQIQPGWALAERYVAVVPRAAPCRVDVLALPGLSLLRRFDATSPVVAIAVDDARDRLILALADGQVLRLEADGRCVVLARTAQATALCLSPGGDRVAVGTVDGRVEIVWVQQVRVLTSLLGGTQPVGSLLFSPDGSRVLAAMGNAARWWPARGGHAQVFELASSEVELVGFTPTGCVITAAAHQRVAAHDLAKGRISWNVPLDGPCVADGQHVWLARLQEILVHDATTGKVLHEGPAPAPVRALAPVPGTHRALVSLTSGTALRTVDVVTGVWSGGTDGHEGAVVAVAFGRDGEGFVTGGLDGRACTWRRDHGSPTLTALAAPTEPVTAVAMDPERGGTWIGAGQTVAYVPEGGDGVRRSRPLGSHVRLVFPIWQTRSVLVCTEASRRYPGTLLLLDAATLEPTHREDVDRTYTRARRRADGTVRIESGRTHAVFEPFLRRWVDDGTVRSRDPSREVHWSLDGSRMVEVQNCQDADGTAVARLFVTELPAGWLLIDGLQTVALSGRAGLSRSGRVLATPHTDGHVRLWDLDRGECCADWDVGMALDAVFVFPDEWRVLGASADGQLVGLFETGP
jgi:WD40 repeat protein